MTAVQQALLTSIATSAYTAFNALPAGWTLTVLANGVGFLMLTTYSTFSGYTTLTAVTTDSGPYANAAALATALQNAAVEPQPATEGYREGTLPV